MKDFRQNYNSKKLGFEMFCEARGWYFQSIVPNDKEAKQFIGRCYDELGYQKTFVITEKGHYLGYCGPGNGTIGKNKAWELVDYVLDKKNEDTGSTEGVL